MYYVVDKIIPYFMTAEMITFKNNNNNPFPNNNSLEKKNDERLKIVFRSGSFFSPDLYTTYSLFMQIWKDVITVSQVEIPKK